MKRTAALLAALLLALSGCAVQQAALEPEDVQSPSENPQQQALAQAAQAGLLHDMEEEDEAAPDGQPEPPVSESAQLDEQAAAARIAESLDMEGCTAQPAGSCAAVDPEGDGRREVFVFEVRDASGEPAGRLAVDKETGERFHYREDGVLDDYESFPLYAAAEEGCSWTGSYASAAGFSLEINQDGDSIFTYRFADGTEGSAGITDNTAKSEDGELNFLFSDDSITVVGGGLTGNYIAEEITEEAE